MRCWQRRDKPREIRPTHIRDSENDWQSANESGGLRLRIRGLIQSGTAGVRWLFESSLAKGIDENAKHTG